MGVSAGQENHADRIAQLIPRLSDATAAVEDRLIHLIRDSANGRVALEDLTSELSRLSKDVRRYYRQAVEMQDRRDLGFKALTRLEKIAQHCVWLYRKIHSEQAFFKKLHLEAQLRALIPAEAFNIYQDVLDAEEEKQLLPDDDATLRARWLAEDDAP